MRRKARTDANQAELVEFARSIGLSVAVTSSLGNGFADAVFGYGGLCMLAEIKDGSKPPSARKLTPAEQRFKDNWTGGLRIVENKDDVLRIKYTLMRWRDSICTLP